MDKLFSLDYGIGGMCVLLTVHVFIKLGEFLWSVREKKESLSEATMRELISAVQANTAATQHLDRRMGLMESSVASLPKLKNDVRRFYIAIKEVAGDRWPKIRDEIMKDEFAQ